MTFIQTLVIFGVMFELVCFSHPYILETINMFTQQVEPDQLDSKTRRQLLFALLILALYQIIYIGLVIYLILFGNIMIGIALLLIYSIHQLVIHKFKVIHTYYKPIDLALTLIIYFQLFQMYF